MQREIMDKLIQWKDSKRRKPLLLTGVRQCGKTFIVRKFAEENYKYVYYMN